jgi:DNA-binding PadR family transcriptional regulator
VDTVAGTERTKGHLDALLLALLASGPQHGYGVIAELRDRSEGELDLPEGTVYPALHRLERAGLLASRWSSEAGRRRRVYVLTSAGGRALGREREQWRAFAGAMETVLGAAAWPSTI